MSKAHFANLEAPFTTIRNDAARDPNLSLKAKGMLLVMRSFGPRWKFHLSHLETLSSDSRDATRNAIKALIEAGYVRRVQLRDDKGLMSGYAYQVSDLKDDPRFTIERDDGAGPTGGLSGDGKAGAGQPNAKNINRQEEQENLQPLSTSSTLSAQPIFAEESKVKAAKPTTPVAPSADHEVALVALYNQHRGVLPETRRINDALVRQIRRFIKEAGGFEEARTILEHGTKEVAADDFWKKNRFTLKNLLADGKVFRRAEAYEAQHEANTPSFSVKDRVRFTTPLGRVEEGVVEALTDKQAVIKQDRDGRIARVPISSVSEVLE